jgi:hypothetical protein
MSFIAPLCVFLLGCVVGGVGGIVLGFVWYEHKSGLLSDHSGKRAAGIRFELDDVFAPSNSDIGITLLEDANLRHPEHLTTSLSWQKRTGNRDVSAMRSVRERPTAG